MSPDGLKMCSSSFGPKETLDRLTTAVADHGMSVLARIDHAALAQEAGLKLRPTEVLIFGNPRSGTPLMQAEQTVGIDLPLKALVWQDANGQTLLAYNDPRWLAARHGVGCGNDGLLNAMTEALAAVVEQATARSHTSDRGQA